MWRCADWMRAAGFPADKPRSPIRCAQCTSSTHLQHTIFFFFFFFLCIWKSRTLNSVESLSCGSEKHNFSSKTKTSSHPVCWSVRPRACRCARSCPYCETAAQNREALYPAPHVPTSGRHRFSCARHEGKCNARSPDLHTVQTSLETV